MTRSKFKRKMQTSPAFRKKFRERLQRNRGTELEWLDDGLSGHGCTVRAILGDPTDEEFEEMCREDDRNFENFMAGAKQREAERQSQINALSPENRKALQEMGLI